MVVLFIHSRSSRKLYKRAFWFPDVAEEEVFAVYEAEAVPTNANKMTRFSLAVFTNAVVLFTDSKPFVYSTLQFTTRSTSNSSVIV